MRDRQLDRSGRDRRPPARRPTRRLTGSVVTTKGTGSVPPLPCDKRKEVLARLQLLGNREFDRIARRSSPGPRTSSFAVVPGLTASGNTEVATGPDTRVKCVRPVRISRIGRVADLEVIGTRRRCLERRASGRRNGCCRRRPARGPSGRAGSGSGRDASAGRGSCSRGGCPRPRT